MSALGLIGTSPANARAVIPQLMVLLEDALASSRRLWLRGRLHGLPGDPSARRWWEKWWLRSTPPQCPTIDWRARIGTITVRGTTNVQADGHFEALVNVDLSSDRRIWRTAHQRVTCGDLSAEASHVVLTPPENSVAAVVVILPLACIRQAASEPRAPIAVPAIKRLSKLLHGLERSAGGRFPIYYLACLPPEDRNGTARTALAAASLRWPEGTLVFLPPRGVAATVCAEALDRLRWLFAGQMELLVLNAEPTLTASLEALRVPADDRAPVTRLINPESVAEWQLCGTSAESRTEAVAELSGTSTSGGPALLARLPEGSCRRRPTRAGLLPRHPIVFCHGMLAFSMLKLKVPEDTNCFTPLRERLRARGFRVLFPQVAPTGGVAERAAALRDQIRRWTDEPVNLIAHSMGGLDARYLITHLGMAERVRSLTTVSSPHRGTNLAEWFMAHLSEPLPLLSALESLGVNLTGFRDCRPEACRAFNEKTPDRPEVRYFSYGGAVPHWRLSPVLRRAWSILTPLEGPNDGMVAVNSARWGEYLGTLQADHFAQTPDGVFLRPGEDFDSLAFFDRLVENLARRGF